MFQKYQQRNSEKWLQSNACEVGFQHMTDIVNAAMKQNGEEEGGKNENKIQTAIRRSLNSLQKQVITAKYFSK
jgi:hypothetical protein